jgi:hypothetical protein
LAGSCRTGMANFLSYAPVRKCEGESQFVI